MASFSLPQSYSRWLPSITVSMLYIAGLQPGTAAVTVQFLDGYGNPDAKVVISVTVTQKGAS